MERPRHRDDRARAGREDADHRRAVRNDEGGARRLLPLRGRRPRRRDRAGRADPAARLGGAVEVRPSWSPGSNDPRAGLPRGVGPRPRHPHRPPRRLRARRGAAPGGVRDRGRALAARGRCPRTRAPGSSTTARNRAIDRIRRDRTLAAKTRLLRSARDAEEDDDRTSKPIPDERLRADLHLLPPGARARGAGRADAADARRAHHRRDRAGVPRRPRRRWPSGWCARSTRSARPGSRTGCRRRTSCPTASPPCSASST